MEIKFSIITAVWNRKGYILRSIQSVLNQDGNDFEVVVFDDGSSDGTFELISTIKDPRVRVGRSSVNRGVNHARNQAIKMAKGEWVIMVDSDDQLCAGSLDIIREDIKRLGSNANLLFYGTKDKETQKLQSFAMKSEIEISYEDFIRHKKAGGELLPVVRRDIIKSESYQEDMMAFEGYLWLAILRKYDGWVHNIGLLEVGKETNNRLSSLIMKPGNLKKRIYSYKKFLAQYGEDFRKYNPQRYLYYRSILSVLYFANGQNKEGKAYLRESRDGKLRAMDLMIRGLSCLGTWPFRLILALRRRFI